MSAFRLASRYAKSLIGLAVEKGNLEEVYNDVKLIDQNIEDNKDLKLMLKSPVVNTDKKLDILNEIYSNGCNEVTLGFIRLLTSKGRESYLPDIMNAFIEQYNESKGITKVKIKTAVEVDRQVIERIKESVKTANKSLEIVTEVDENLIGGYVLQYEDRLFDASVARNLEVLKQQIVDDSYIKQL